MSWQPNATTLIIDSPYLCYQAFYTMGKFSHEDKATGVIYGFLMRLLALGEKFKTNDIVFGWDSKISLRKRKHDFYKSKRKERNAEKAEEMSTLYDQFDALRIDLLPLMGFNNNYIFGGYESDDIIGRIVQDSVGRFVVVAGDEDLYQLLYNCRVYNPSKKILLSAKGFTREYGIDPHEWVRVKQIAGCTSDSVPGVPGVGEKTAIKYIRGELASKLKTFKAIESEEGKEAIARNFWLVKLPLPTTPPIQKVSDHLSIDGFRQVCLANGFDSFLQEEKRWNDFFQGRFKDDEEA